MKILFDTKKIDKLCNNHQYSRKKIGVERARVLQRRLAGLSQVKRLGDFNFGHPHPLKGDRKDQFSIRLDGDYRLAFKAVEPMPKTNDDIIDWRNVKQIIIIFIGDYHE